jgi:hypothetical protein
MDKRKYASADGKRGDNQGYRVKSYRHRECAILGAQSKFVKETMNCQGFEHIDQARTVDCPEGYSVRRLLIIGPFLRQFTSLQIHFAGLAIKT